VAIKIAFIFTFLPASFGFKAIEIDSDWSKWWGLKRVGRETEREKEEMEEVVAFNVGCALQLCGT